MSIQVRQTTEVVITLSEYEALFLQTVMAHIGGPGVGPRGIADELHRRLYELDLDPGAFTNIAEGSIYFK